MAPLKTILDELHRRSLWQVLGIFVAASWAVLQFVDFLVAYVGLPPWVPSFALALCAIGLPIVLATAFVQQGHPLKGRVETDPTLLPGYGDESEPARQRLVHRVLTWRRALGGGALAFVGLAALIGGYMGMRALGIGAPGTLLAAGVMTPSDRIVLADFDATADFATTADLITEALRVDLLQSNAFALVDPAEVQQVLVRMERETGTRLTDETAREIAQREGYKLVLAGEVGRLGTGWVVAARLVDVASGQMRAAFRETAANDDGLLAAVDRLSGSIRTKIGESFKSLNASEPLERVTTSSLDALLKYTIAERIATGREPANGRTSIELMREAVALDSTFAMAQRKLGAWLTNGGFATEALDAFRAAYRHRDRLPAIERYLAEGLYYDRVAGDVARAAQAHQRVLEIDPNQKSALNNATFQFAEIGQLDAAIAAGERGIKQPYPYVTQFYNLAGAYIQAGRFADALAMADSSFAYVPRTRYGYQTQIDVAANQFDYAPIDSITAELSTRYPQNTTLGAYVLAIARANALATRGRLREADRQLADVAAKFADTRFKDRVLYPHVLRATLDVHVRNMPDAVRQRVRDALAIAPLDSIPALDFSNTSVALLYAQIGDVAEAERWLQRDDAARPEVTHQKLDYHIARARLLLNAQQPQQAITLLQRAERERACGACLAPYFAEAYEMVGDRDAAIAQYQRYLNTPFPGRLRLDALYLAHTYFRLGELMEQKGDRSEAARLYGKFIALWQHADPELQPRVQAASERLAQLAGRR